MRWSTVHLAGAMALASGVAANVARADSQRNWTLCTPGGFRSCHSLQLATTPVVSGSVRTGTVITVTVHNLQGQLPDDNTMWSWLYEVFFFSANPAAEDAFDIGWVPGSPGGGATGASVSQLQVFLSSGYSYADLLAVDESWVYGGVGGCAPGDPSYATAHTCGPDAGIAFSLTTGVVLDADWFNTAYIHALGSTTDSTGSTEDGDCFSDPGAFGEGYRQCEFVAPEPVSIALLGTGLLGVGVIRRRWRRR